MAVSCFITDLPFLHPPNPLFRCQWMERTLDDSANRRTCLALNHIDQFTTVVLGSSNLFPIVRCPSLTFLLKQSCLNEFPKRRAQAWHFPRRSWALMWC